MNPDDRKYFKEHEWVKAEDGRGLVGISDFAQSALGDIVFLDLPAVGTVVTAGEPCGEIESVKSVSSIYAPVSGVVTRHNDEVSAAPELVNQDPYGKGWLFEVELSDPSELDGLMSASEYDAFTKD